MTKKNQKIDETADQRQSRKEVLRERKHQEQMRNIRVGVIIVGVILAAVVLFALVNEFIISPQSEVASVSGEKITLQDWQNRVKFERAQRIMNLEDQLEMVNNDVGLVQQFSAQTINELRSYETLGESVLDTMARELIITQALRERGIEITAEDIQKSIEESFNYYGGESPPVSPKPMDEPEPTPSITPIGAEAAEPTAESQPEPTSAPVPKATPVSSETFQQEFDDLISRFNGYGVDESLYRSLVGDSLSAERMLDVLAEEQNMPTEDEQASAYLLIFSSEEEAQNALTDIEGSDYLTVWNTIQNTPADTADTAAFPPSASEIIWQTQDAIISSYGPEIADAVFNTPLNQPSDILTVSGSDGSVFYIITQTSGMEVRPLPETELRSRKIQLLSDYIDEKMNSAEVVIGQNWRSRVPTRPILDPKFLASPTATPVVTPVPDTGSSE
ncbi:MAG: SurA N-terminal domain-containing protein [Candidatus Promineifilaceae bacterium]|jgi:hypothetical protein